ncbi:MAG: transporter substrate-binding domain-containing protein [Clostridia bacterium]|nr:transporter substrate-binding domain-containing protein [Clostridia bacterium]
MKKLISILLVITSAISLVLFTASCGKKQEQGTLRVGMECAYAPYNWTQPTNANGAVPIKDSQDFAYGYDVMMAQKIADELGMKLEIVKLAWDSLVPAVQSGTIDCAIAGQSITKERSASVDFTEPYYYATIVTLVKKGNKYDKAQNLDDLKGASAISQINTIWYDKCVPQIPSVKKLPAMEETAQMLVALNSGKCDVVVTDLPTGKAALIAYPDFVMTDFAKVEGSTFQVSDEDVNIGISIKKGNKELVDKINGVLKKMTPEDYNKMMDEAIKVQPLSK